MNGCRFITKITYDVKFKESYKISKPFRPDFQLINISMAPLNPLPATHTWSSNLNFLLHSSLQSSFSVTFIVVFGENLCIMVWLQWVTYSDTWYSKFKWPALIFLNEECIRKGIQWTLHVRTSVVWNILFSICLTGKC